MHILEHDPLSVLAGSIDGLLSQSKPFGTSQCYVGQSLLLVGGHVFYSSWGKVVSLVSYYFFKWNVSVILEQTVEYSHVLITYY